MDELREGAIQLRYWFPPVLCRLFDRHDIQFTTWRADEKHVLEGKFQAVFDRRASTCLDRRAPSAVYSETPALAA